MSGAGAGAQEGSTSRSKHTGAGEGLAYVLGPPNGEPSGFVQDTWDRRAEIMAGDEDLPVYSARTDLADHFALMASSHLELHRGTVSEQRPGLFARDANVYVELGWDTAGFRPVGSSVAGASTFSAAACTIAAQRASSTSPRSAAAGIVAAVGALSSSSPPAAASGTSPPPTDASAAAIGASSSSFAANAFAAPSAPSSYAAASTAAARVGAARMTLPLPISGRSKTELGRIFPRVDDVPINDGRTPDRILSAIKAARIASGQKLTLDRHKDNWGPDIVAVADFVASLAKEAPDFEALGANRGVARDFAACLQYAAPSMVTGLALAVEAKVAVSRKSAGGGVSALGGGGSGNAGDPRALALTAIAGAHCTLTERDFGGDAQHFALVYAWSIGLPAVVVKAEAERVLGGDRRSRQTGEDLPLGFMVALASAYA